MIELSVIVPFYNSENTLHGCLESIERSLIPGVEVILVNDDSKDSSVEIASSFPFELIHLEKNYGPATARNKGAEMARGKYLVFIDSDVYIRKDTLSKVLNGFLEHPETAGHSGIYSDVPAEEGWIQEFKSLEATVNYSAYPGGNYTSFDTFCAAIKREVFFEVGGFNTAYRGADMEDAEFGHALTARYLNIIDPEIVAEHVYESYPKGLWKYLRRSFLWARLFLMRPRFDNAVTTAKNASSVAVSALILLSSYLKTPWEVTTCLIMLFAFVNRKFLFLAVSKYAVPKACFFMFIMWTMHVAVALGASLGLLWWAGPGRVWSPFRITHKELSPDVVSTSAAD